MAATRHLELWIALIVLVLDQVTKAIVRSQFALHDAVPVIPGFFNLTRVHNTGAAFGMLNSVNFPFKTAALSVVAAGALAGLAYFAASLPAAQRLSRVGIALIIGGAAGNLIDRIALGYVTDFVDVYWQGWHFWAFNVADAAITVGVALMILDMLGVAKLRPKSTGQA
ncbi:MAG TPA: signal peptidase II [Vicinamibacterales bacterium]